MSSVSTRTAVLLAAMLAAGCAAGAGMGGGMEESPSAPSHEQILGTWQGVAYGEGDVEGVDVTLILTEQDGQLTGHVSVPEQMMDRTPLRGLTWQDDVLSCYVDMQGMRVDVRLTLEAGVFNGSFYSDEISGVMTLRKP